MFRESAFKIATPNFLFRNDQHSTKFPDRTLSFRKFPVVFRPRIFPKNNDSENTFRTRMSQGGDLGTAEVICATYDLRKVIARGVFGDGPSQGYLVATRGPKSCHFLVFLLCNVLPFRIFLACAIFTIILQRGIAKVAFLTVRSLEA
ncbi:uncharacterized protein EAE97_001280 [Botrytis byssoidea]|uniref:Uncharacterized protein n=1 Tax=Botrytis byssoidea TaxID=139641 RepID=A0A9P5IYC0_9HELO|nr:uncharacterized protein EAE97_001280 [Botrytis byssoidea]KAF7953881.1 hypothetical protein EAE97_001280 [Botrytis byssoidea]